MKPGLNCVTLAGLVLLGSSMLIAADDAMAPATQPTEETTHHRKLVQPWGEMTSLTDDQKEQIEKIHQASLDAEKQLRDKERADIEALLTDDQKQELKKVEEDAAAERKERAASRRKTMEQSTADSTTQPSN